MAIVSQSEQKVRQITHMVAIFEFWCNVSRHTFVYFVCFEKYTSASRSCFLLVIMLDTWICFDP